MKKTLTFEKLDEIDYYTREAFNSLRTNLQFCGNKIKVIALTSCTPNEGKSTVSFELCRNIAETGKKVILVDVDLRKSVIVGQRRITTEGEILGMTHYLSGQCELDDMIYETNVENMDTIVAGTATPNPTELLATEKFADMLTKLRAEYDYVVIDTPPLGSVIDSAIIAPQTDGAVLVIESGRISFRFAQKVKQQLESSGCNILGTILNKVDISTKGYYGKYYGKYYGSKYYGDEKDA